MEAAGTQQETELREMVLSVALGDGGLHRALRPDREDRMTGIRLQGGPAGEQLALEVPASCKVRGCPHPVVGSSTTGEGHVCRGHNEAEWGNALRKYNPPVSAALLADSKRSLTRSVLALDGAGA